MNLRTGLLAVVSASLVCAMSATAQVAPWIGPGQVDAAAILNFDPAGAHGVPLTCDLVRTFLAKPVPKPSLGKEQLQASMNRSREANAAKKAMLSDETIYMPLWEERAFQLQDGSVRPMTDFEKSILAELDAIDAENSTSDGKSTLSYANETERHAYAEALCGLLAVGVQIAGREYIGYRKIDGDWKHFGGWREGPDRKTLVEFDITPETMIALLRYELALQQLELGRAVRRSSGLAVFSTTSRTPQKPF